MPSPPAPKSATLEKGWSCRDLESDVLNCLENGIEIVIKQLKTKDTFTVRVEPLDTIQTLKLKVHEALSRVSEPYVQPSNLRLLFKGKSLNDHQLVSDYALSSGAVVHLSV